MPKKKEEVKEAEEKSSVEKTQTAVKKEKVAEKTAAKTGKTDTEKKTAVAEPAKVSAKTENDKSPDVAEDAAAEKEVSPKVLEVLKTVEALSIEERTEFCISLIKGLRVLELSKWVKALEGEFGISAAMPVAVGGVAAGQAAESGDEEAKDSFSVMLTGAGDKKIQVIKEVRTITSLGLREAKALVDECPKPVKEDVPEKEANEIKEKLEAVGASVELK